MTAIRTKNLSKHFQIAVKKPGLSGALASFFKRDYKNVEAVKSVSFDIEKGELVGFLGPNGAGKTTTLKMLSGLLYPSSGLVEVMGHVPHERKTEFQKKFSIVMGQRTQLWWELPARETFILNQKIYEIPENEFQEMREELVRLLEINDLISVPVKKLSLGERMKAELACALLHKPEVLLLDEPTLGLDVVMQKKLRHFIKDYNQKYNATILLTSHNMNDVEELCKRVMIIDDGQLLYDGNLQNIVEQYAPDKSVTLTTPQAPDLENLAKFGRIVLTEGHSVKIEVPRKEIPQLMAKLLSQVAVVDLTIEELPIEEIVRRIFLKIPVPKPKVEPKPSEESDETVPPQSLANLREV